MTSWKWVRVPGALHDRAAAVRDAVTSERARRDRARTEVSYYEIFEMALDALERERGRGVDRDDAGRVPGDAGHGNMGGMGDAGGT